MSNYGGIATPTPDELIALRDVAAGKRPADLAIRGGRVVFVHTGEIREADVLISGRRIAAITEPNRLQAINEFDATGKYVAPTFIESHLHIEYTLLPTGELARLTVPRGTTTVLADPNCSAAVRGNDGIDYISHTKSPLRVWLQISAAIPGDPSLELGGQAITDRDRAAYLADPRVVSLGESNPFTLDRAAANDLATAFANGRRATGHTARIDGEPLWAYIAGGIGDDHNAATFKEVLDRIRLGLIVTIQSSSLTNYLEPILGDHALLNLAANHLAFCADDKHVADLVDEGHIDFHVREAVKLGVPPALAIRMGSLNAALHFRIDQHVGSLTPSRFADVQVLPDLVSFKPTAVFVGGQQVADNGRALFANEDAVPRLLHHSVRVDVAKTKHNIKVPAPGKTEATVRVAEIYDGYYTRELEAVLPVKDGYVQPDPARDISKIVVVDRHHGTGSVGAAFATGFGLKRGALATTTNCSNQNIVAIGTSDEDILAAVEALIELGGGYVAVDNGRVIGELPLPIMGMMSDQPWETVYAQLKAIDKKAATLGCPVPSPFMMISFVGLAAVPELGLTECGLIDARTQKFVPVVKDAGTTGASSPTQSTNGSVNTGAHPVTTDNGWKSVPLRTVS